MAQTSLNSTGVASSGALSLQSNGTTEAIGISTGQVATLAQNPILTSGTVNGLAFLNASKVLTTGSALTFDGTNFKVGIGGAGQIQIGTASSASFQTALYSSNGVDTDFQVRFKTGLTDIGLSTATGLSFSISNSEQMRLTSTGLGIGTSSPNYSLTSYKGGAIANYLQVASGATGAGAGNGLLLGVDASGNSVINAQGAINLYTYVAGVLRTTIDSAGNLGLGVTPSAWFSSRKAFSIYASASFVGVSDGGAEVWGNGYLNSAGNSIYATSAGAALYQVNKGANGTHAWLTAPSGTAGNAISFTQAMTLDASGRLLLGTTSGSNKLEVASNGSVTSAIRATSAGSSGSPNTMKLSFVGVAGDGVTAQEKAYVLAIDQTANTMSSYLAFGVNASGTVSEAARIDSSGNLLVGGTTRFSTERVSINQTVAGAQALYTKNLSGDFNFNCWNAATSGDNLFIQFITEASPTSRGSITYNRGAGLVAYNVTSDYRAKDIIGPVADSGALIDSVPVYMGKMKGATQERPMFIAHEVPAYAHTGEKDAVDADGNPVYQQMDASALIPVMWAEIQSLRKRLATLESK